METRSQPDPINHPACWSYWAGRTLHYLPHAQAQARQRGLCILTALPPHGQVVADTEDEHNNERRVYRLQVKVGRKTLCLVASETGSVITCYVPTAHQNWDRHVHHPRQAAKSRRNWRKFTHRAKRGYAA